MDREAGSLTVLRLGLRDILVVNQIGFSKANQTLEVSSSTLDLNGINKRSNLKLYESSRASLRLCKALVLALLRHLPVRR